MISGWSSDFSYNYYRKLLEALRANFRIHLFSNAPQILEPRHERPIVLLRHDLDLDLDAALNMAEIENRLDIRSCYMVMTNCPFYNVEDESSRRVLLLLKQMGNEIGLHCDFNDQHDRDGKIEFDSLVSRIDDSAKLLEDVISSKVLSISFHRPLKQFLKGPLLVAGRVNAYAAELMNWYLSDSKGNWREGEPLPMLEHPLERPLLQLLTHPIWWGDKHMSSTDRLQSFYIGRTQGLSVEGSRLVDKALRLHLSIFRSEITN